MLFITAVVFILIKYFGYINSSWEIIILFISSFVAIAFSINIYTSRYASRCASVNFVLSLEEKVNELEGRVEELESRIRERFVPSYDDDSSEYE